VLKVVELTPVGVFAASRLGCNASSPGKGTLLTASHHALSTVRGSAGLRQQVPSRDRSVTASSNILTANRNIIASRENIIAASRAGSVNVAASLPALRPSKVGSYNDDESRVGSVAPSRVASRQPSLGEGSAAGYISPSRAGSLASGRPITNTNTNTNTNSNPNTNSNILTNTESGSQPFGSQTGSRQSGRSSQNVMAQVDANGQIVVVDRDSACGSRGGREEE
jgi:hypothetical protein